jgi:hypothetical protein
VPSEALGDTSAVCTPRKAACLHLCLEPALPCPEPVRALGRAPFFTSSPCAKTAPTDQKHRDPARGGDAGHAMSQTLLKVHRQHRLSAQPCLESWLATSVVFTSTQRALRVVDQSLDQPVAASGCGNRDFDQGAWGGFGRGKIPHHHPHHRHSRSGPQTRPTCRHHPARSACRTWRGSQVSSRLQISRDPLPQVRDSAQLESCRAKGAPENRFHHSCS